MKKKTKTKPSTVDTLRSETAYGGIRLIFGLPFYISGLVSLAIAALLVPVALSSGSPITIGIIAVLVIAGLFNLSIPALANALLDIADASVRNETREAQRDARAAYEEYKRSQPGAARQSA